MNEESRGRLGSNYRWVGKNTRRPDGVDKVTGRARYGDDMKLPGMLYGRFSGAPTPTPRSSSWIPPRRKC